VTIVGASLLTTEVIEQLNLDAGAVAVVSLLRWPVVFAFLSIAVAILYKVAPNFDLPFKWALVGGVTFSIAWLVATAAFALYVANFANYANTYGALGGVIVLLFWMWLSAQAMLLGAEVDAVLRRVGHARARKEAETKAPPAVIADAAAPLVLAPPPPPPPAPRALLAPRPRRAPRLLSALLPALFFAVGLLVGRRRAR